MKKNTIFLFLSSMLFSGFLTTIIDSNVSSVSAKICGQVVFNGEKMYDNYIKNQDDDDISFSDNQGWIVGKKNIEKISSSVWLSLLLYQDGVARPVLIRNKIISYFDKNNAYFFSDLTKIAEKRYILHTMRDYYKGGDDYYEIDLRNLNIPVFRKISLTKAINISKIKCSRK